MTKFFIKWWADQRPNTSEELAKLKLKMLEMVKADLSAGRLTEWGSFSNGRTGYAITEASEVDLNATMLKYMPAIGFDVFPVLNVDQQMEAVKKAAAAMQA